MEVRDKMYAWRKEHLLSLDDMAELCRCSATVLNVVESGGVTHPKIVERIRAGYRLSELEAEALLPKIHRPHGGDYEPDRFRSVLDQAPLCVPNGVASERMFH